ncbi:MAG: bifunctional rhamnulose-1-phosphate aldolase/short-chain dehydrogenase [Candidatus Omnitrophota bacterium]|nr:bifunctional rhamnulose-1-phosphate aldolase/short-chain dehydrogenase [Candidatus Omnitrophota bacterium]
MKNLWNSKESAKAKDKLGLLVYSSRLVGSEPKLCVWGGGNTSTKTVERDHLGAERRVLRIKGSGSDLKQSERKHFPPVDLDGLRYAFRFKKMTDQEMVDFVARCLLDPKAPRPSIEVLLHAFVDEIDITHTHADAILSITNTHHGKSIAREIYGDELLWVPYVKPGFTLAKWVGKAYQKCPEAKGLILENHGLITWAEDAKTSYSLTIQMVSRAERYLAVQRKKRKYWSAPVYIRLSRAGKRKWLLRYLPVLRRAVSQRQPAVLKLYDSPQVMEFVNARDAAKVSQVGPATPDHMLRTKRHALYLKPPGKSPESLTGADIVRQVNRYAQKHETYFLKYRSELKRSLSNGSAQMLDPYPKVILVPGVGMLASGRDLKSAAIVGEIYEHSISVMVSATSVDRYRSLTERLAFEMEYWPMELYKLSLQPPEAELSRRVGLVTGAAGGIGKAIARHLAASGAHVFIADLDGKKVSKLADEINEQVGKGRVFAVTMDVTDASSVTRGLESIVLTTGGLDFIVSNAGVAHVSSIELLHERDWEKSFSVNARGHFLVAREAVRIMRRQVMGGSIVFIASKNVLAPGKDFGAYSAAKAAQVQLGRILAIENGEFGIRVNLINPDGVFEGSGLWNGIRENRARSYGISSKRLEDFYVNRNLMKTRVLPEDVAEAVTYLISSRSAKTTGCILTVDGGVKEAFPR